VFFAVMEPTGQGPVLTSLRTIAAQPTVFSYGTVETNKGLAVQSPDGEMGIMTSFAALTKNVPEPFKKETDGGPGMHIHDKFVVVDFNAANPTVFTGSSNLAAGGENQNGDNLAMIEDAAVANMYAIEAVALFDHFHFRKAMQQVTTAQPPLALWYPGKPNAPDPWWKAYYDPKQIQMRDRYLFADLPLPAGLAATKDVDWSALPPPKKSKEKSKGKATSTGAAKKSTAKKSSAKKSKKSSSKKSSSKKAAAKKVKAKKAGKKPVKKKTKKAPAKQKSAKKKSAKTKKTAVKKKSAVKKKRAAKKPAKKRKSRS
jgi:hypothetical protein